MSDDNKVVELTEQPKPPFTLQDLDKALMEILNLNSDFIKKNRAILNNDSEIQKLITANQKLHELVAVVTKHINDLEPIDMPVVSSEVIQEVIRTEKPEFHVCGVQLIENGVLKGTSLYSTVVKGRQIRDILNKKFAELRVNHVAKILHYPVF